MKTAIDKIRAQVRRYEHKNEGKKDTQSGQEQANSAQKRPGKHLNPEWTFPW